MKFIALKTKDGESKGEIAFMEISAAGGCHAGDTFRR